jgi:MoxR-like ATPase
VRDTENAPREALKLRIDEMARDHIPEARMDRLLMQIYIQYPEAAAFRSIHLAPLNPGESFGTSTGKKGEPA